MNIHYYQTPGLSILISIIILLSIVLPIYLYYLMKRHSIFRNVNSSSRTVLILALVIAGMTLSEQLFLDLGIFFNTRYDNIKKLLELLLQGFIYIKYLILITFIASLYFYVYLQQDRHILVVWYVAFSIIAYFSTKISFAENSLISNVANTSGLVTEESTLKALNNFESSPILLRFFVIASLSFAIISFFVESYRESRASKRKSKERKGGGVKASNFNRESLDEATSILCWVGAILSSMYLSGFNPINLGVFTALIGAGLTISFRDLINNFASGLLLHWDGSIKQEDVIRTHDGVVGEVMDINIRYLYLTTPDKIDILIPNSELVKNRFENLTRTNNEVRLKMRFVVDLNSDVRHVERLAIKAALSCIEVSTGSNQMPAVFYVGVSDRGCEFELRFWVYRPQTGPAKLRSIVGYALHDELKRGGVKLPNQKIEFSFAQTKQPVDRDNPIDAGGDPASRS